MKVETLTTRYDPAETEITLTVQVDVLETAGLELKGRLAGPCTTLAETIEVPYPLKATATEDGLLRGRVVIPDPCMWTPETPFLYRGTVELWQQGQRLETAEVQHGIKELFLRQKGLRLNGEPLVLRCYAGRGIQPDQLPTLRQQGINALLIQVGPETEPLWAEAAKWGFFLLAQVDPSNDELLWHANEALLHQTALFGWVLPQSLIRQPQHWHNAMSLLHGHRRDVFVGVKIEELPHGVLPGHVDFLLADAESLTEAAAEKIAKIIQLQRGETQPDPATKPPHTIGWVLRTLPGS
jgi:hypothetical protein